MSSLDAMIRRKLREVVCWRCEQPTPIAVKARVQGRERDVTTPDSIARDVELCRRCFQAWLNAGAEAAP